MTDFETDKTKALGRYLRQTWAADKLTIVFVSGALIGGFVMYEATAAAYEKSIAEAGDKLYEAIKDEYVNNIIPKLVDKAVDEAVKLRDESVYGAVDEAVKLRDEQWREQINSELNKELPGSFEESLPGAR